MITKWEDMPIGVFEQMYHINRLHADDEEKEFRIAALLSGMDYEEFIRIPLIDARSIIEQMGFLYTEPKKKSTRRSYKIGSRTYRLMKNVDEFTTAQYINYQMISNTPVEQSLGELMAIVLVPEGKTYGEENEEEIVDEIKEYFNIEDALSVADFFIVKFERSIKRMLRYSDRMMQAARLTARNKEDREMLKALSLEMRLTTDAIWEEFGSLWSKRSVI